MRILYSIFDVGRVELEPAFKNKRWDVSALYVEPGYRGLGVGTALMNVVCRDADVEGVELWLVPLSPEGRKEDLLHFYVRLGFEKRDPYMVRPPSGTWPAGKLD